MKFTLVAATALMGVSEAQIQMRHEIKKHSKWGMVEIMDTEKGEHKFDDGHHVFTEYLRAMWTYETKAFPHLEDGAKTSHILESAILNRVTTLVKNLFTKQHKHQQQFEKGEDGKYYPVSEKKVTKKIVPKQTTHEKNSEHHDSPFYEIDQTEEAEVEMEQKPKVTRTGTPIAVFHGFGDACTMPGVNKLERLLVKGTGSSYIKCIETGIPAFGGMFNNFHTIAQQSCNDVASNPHFAKEFNVVGLSQGSLLARYIVEECEMPGKVRNMISLGGPNMGIAAHPHCFDGFGCTILNTIVKKLVYTNFAQYWSAPAGYFRDINNMPEYIRRNVFLPALNNEISQKSEYSDVRKNRISDLNSLMLVKFDNDSVLYPKETAWFQEVDKTGKVIPLNQTDFYTNDFIGLRALNEAEKVQWVTFEGDHLQLTSTDISDTLVPFLKK